MSAYLVASCNTNMHWLMRRWRGRSQRSTRKAMQGNRSWKPPSIASGGQ